ncbi:hypothetical protein TNCV_2791791 [Trichonephila clavipes]|nr:hypothetical protein TNCV_2791791 [Trichonephila clavipes]
MCQIEAHEFYRDKRLDVPLSLAKALTGGKTIWLVSTTILKGEHPEDVYQARSPSETITLVDLLLLCQSCTGEESEEDNSGMGRLVGRLEWVE